MYYIFPANKNTVRRVKLQREEKIPPVGCNSYNLESSRAKFNSSAKYSILRASVRLTSWAGPLYSGEFRSECTKYKLGNRERWQCVYDFKADGWHSCCQPWRALEECMQGCPLPMPHLPQTGQDCVCDLAPLTRLIGLILNSFAPQVARLPLRTIENSPGMNWELSVLLQWI